MHVFKLHRQALDLLNLVAWPVVAGCLWLSAGCDAGKAGSAPGTAATRPVQSLGEQFGLVEQTARTGIEFRYDNGRAARQYTILETLGGGVALFDYDLDGLDDVFMTGGGQIAPDLSSSGLPSALYRNLGQWRTADVTSDALVGESPHYSHGIAAGDFNSDGFPDVLVTGYGGLLLFQNQGDGTFQEVHEQAGLADQLWSTSAGWADMNADGHLDLYVAHYVDWSAKTHVYCPGPSPDVRELCAPIYFEPLPDTLYCSQGDGTFRDASQESGLRKDGKGLGVLLADVDHDGDTDIYVANDMVDNFLYLNDGRGMLTEVGLRSGVARGADGNADGSMGVDLGDYNLDGKPDIWVANFENETFALYRNEGSAIFQHVSQSTGITALGGLFVGFGTAFADLDRDGDEDLVCSNGHVINFPLGAPVKQLPLLLVNQQGVFERAKFQKAHYFKRPHRGRGLATGDLDEDGDLDLAFTHNDDEPAAFLMNETKAKGSWLRVRLIGRRSNRDAVGARLVLRTSEGRQLRHVKGGASYLSQSDPRPFWGVPRGARIKDLLVHWPTGRVQRVSKVPSNTTLTLIEPAR